VHKALSSILSTTKKKGGGRGLGEPPLLGIKKKKRTKETSQCPLDNLWRNKRFSRVTYNTLTEALFLKKVALTNFQQRYLPVCSYVTIDR
jgi:hypothetical protein